MEGEGVGSRVSDTGSSVETTTLDELAREYGSPRILKMDIEGSEGRALKGAREALRGLELAMLEVHDEANYAAVGAVRGVAGSTSSPPPGFSLS